MSAFIQNFFTHFDITHPNEQWLLLGLLVTALVCLFFRIVLAVGYQGQNTIVALTSRTELNSKEDVSKLKNGPFARAAKEYVLLGERGVTRIDTRAIVEKNLLRMNLLFWNFRSIQRFVTALESALLPVGLLFILLVIGSHSPFFVFVLAILFFTRLAASIVDFNVAQEKFVTNTTYLLDREIGRFFPNDATSALFALREELKAGMAMQSRMLAEAMEKTCAAFSDTVAASLETTAAGMERTAASVMESTETLLANLAEQTQSLSAPLADWRAALQSTEATQRELNTALDSINKALGSFAGATDIVTPELELMRTHQTALKSSLQQYEHSLRDITAQLGDSLGKMVDFHLQQSYGTLTDGVQDSMTRIMTGNNDLLQRLQDLFAQMQEQSRNETATIMRMKDQMDIHFSELKAKP